LSALILTKALVLLALLLCSGFFSGSETSFFSLGRLERFFIPNGKESLTPRWIHLLLQHPRRLLVSILIGNECIVIAASAVSASLTVDVFQGGPIAFGEVGLLLKTLVATAFVFPLILILGETMPRALALRNPQRVARISVVPLRIFARVVAPVRWILEGLANRIVRLVLRRPLVSETPMSEKEFRSLVDMSREGGELWESEHQFIHNIFEFGEARVSELMSPRTDMVCLRLDQARTEVLKAIEEHHFSRIPVYDKDKDDVVGVLYPKDILQESLEPTRQEAWNLKSILRRPFFVPQTKKASDLFREFRSNRIHMAIVVDEYGGGAGLVTMEDLLEDLFGEILDEYDFEEPSVRQVDENTLIIPARMSIEDFNRQLETELPKDEYDTMGGLVFDLFGRLPTPGAKVSYMHFTFVLEKMLGTRMLEIRVQKHPDQEDASQAGNGTLPAETKGES